MTSTPREERVAELDDDTRQAWTQYNERLRELTGEEYERAESDSWDELQDELRRLQERREQLLGASA